MMADAPQVIANESASKHLLTALCAALVTAVVCLAYSANVERPQNSVITGNLNVSYMLITLKTDSTEQSSGSTISATRVEFFPNYVLVTGNDVTRLWPIDRLKKLDVSVVSSTADE
jgi:hypothetical protein